MGFYAKKCNLKVRTSWVEDFGSFLAQYLASGIIKVCKMVLIVGKEHDIDIHTFKQILACLRFFYKEHLRLKSAKKSGTAKEQTRLKF